MKHPGGVTPPSRNSVYLGDNEFVKAQTQDLLGLIGGDIWKGGVVAQVAITLHAWVEFGVLMLPEHHHPCNFAIDSEQDDITSFTLYTHTSYFLARALLSSGV